MQPVVDGVWMRMAVTGPNAAWLSTRLDLLETTGRPRPFRPLRTSCLVNGDSLALFRFRPLPDAERTDDVATELGMLGFGPARHDLTDRVLSALHAWDADRHLEPERTLHPADTPDDHLPPAW